MASSFISCVLWTCEAILCFDFLSSSGCEACDFKYLCNVFKTMLATNQVLGELVDLINPGSIVAPAEPD